MDYKVNGSRGRPSKSWSDTTEEDLAVNEMLPKVLKKRNWE